MKADQWILNVGSERDWGFVGESNPHLNGRSMFLSMGKVLEKQNSLYKAEGLVKEFNDSRTPTLPGCLGRCRAQRPRRP